jgi:hypothetical protein
VRVAGRRLVATIVAPATPSSAITEDFISFVKSRTASPLRV